MRHLCSILIILMSTSTLAAQEHRQQIRNVLDAQRRLQLDIESIESTIDRELAIAERLYQAVVVINDPQEHNGAERAMEHVRAARRLSEEGDRSIHLRQIIQDATELIETHREWIHSSDLYEVHERYHHRVIHPMMVELAEDLMTFQDLESGGIRTPGLDAVRDEVERMQLKLLRYSDIRYE